MKEFKYRYQAIVAQALNELAEQLGIVLESPLEANSITVETPPPPILSDLGFPLFPFAKIFRKAPAVIAQSVLPTIELLSKNDGVRWEVQGAYINLFLAKDVFTKKIMEIVFEQGKEFGTNQSFKKEKIMIEFSGPNANKPLHLGHLRNDALGESLARILNVCGAEVVRANIINDRGIHICKSMLAYQKFGNSETPESIQMKSDHFVGKYYVKFNDWAKEDSTAEEQAQQMLRDWEAGDPSVMKLWETMTEWAISGIKESYRATQVHFDRYYFESQTYSLGKNLVVEGLEKNIFQKDETGASILDLSPINLDTKIFLRSDNSSLYITQDLGTAVSRHKDFPFDRMIYVVASEQDYHFQVLFYALQQLGYSWAKNLYHLSYGMVNLPDGKMKSREGTIVDADDLLESLTEFALRNMEERDREPNRKIAHDIALGALHYYLLQISPHKDMIFDAQESLAFNGNTGPYLQYTGARISSIERKVYGFREKDSFVLDSIDWSELDLLEEWELLKEISCYEMIVEQAGLEYSPHLISNYLFQLCKKFSRYYHDHPIWDASAPKRSEARFLLTLSVKQVLKNGLYCLNIPFLENM